MRRPVAVRVIGPSQWILWPALATLVLTILLAVPFELFGLHLPEPVLPMVLAFAWPLIRPSMLAAAVLFGLGLFLDLLWGNVLGLWPLCLMVVFGGALAARNLLAGQETHFLFFWYAVGTAMAFFLAYVIVTLASNIPPSLFSLLGQVLPTLLLFPLAHIMIERFDDGDTRLR